MHVIKNLSLLFVVIQVLFCFSCKKENCFDCIKRTGKIEKENRLLNGFNRIIVNNDVNVFITQDSIFEVVVEAGKNIIPLIVTEVSDSTLVIKNNNRCKWTRSYNKPLNVYVKMPFVKYITSFSSGKITSLNTITTNMFNIEIRSSGDIELTVDNNTILSEVRNVGDLYLHGKTLNHNCNIHDNSFLYSQDLMTDYTQITTYSTGNCYINVANQLDYTILAIGDIYCSEKPTIINKTDTGKGKIYFE